MAAGTDQIENLVVLRKVPEFIFLCCDVLIKGKPSAAQVAFTC